MSRRNRTGRVHVPDRRDRKYLLTAGSSNRTSRTWKSHWSGDQGPHPHCVAFAWKGVITSSPIVQGKSIDPVELYELCKYKDEWQGEDYDGTSVRAGAAILKMAGYIEEYRWAFDLETVIYTILEVGPMVLGTNWYKGMDTPDREGVIHVQGRVLGGHAYGLVGVSKRTKRFKIKQSWGDEWGENGFAEISFDDVDRLIREDGEACIVKEIKA